MAGRASTRKRQTRRKRPEASPTARLDASLGLASPQDLSPGIEEAFTDWQADLDKHPDLAELLEEARSLSVASELRGSTQVGYQEKFGLFSKWCEQYELSPLPAAPITVCAFAQASVKRGVKVRSVEEVLHAINSAHQTAGYQPPCAHPVVKRVMGSLRRQKASTNTNRKAHPIQPDELKKLIEGLNQVRFQFINRGCLTTTTPATKEAKRLYTEVSRKYLGAVLLTGWHSAQRVNVLLRAEVDWLAVVDENLTLAADREKMHDEGFTSVLLPTTDSTICPVETLLEWLDLRAQYVEEGCSRLFPAPAIRDGEFVLVDYIGAARSHLLQTNEEAKDLSPEALDYWAYVCSYNFYYARLKKLAKAVGVTPDPDRYFATHSTRRGVITALRAKGLDPQVIAARVSGHANPSTVLLYDDSHRLSEHAHPVSGLGL